MERAINELASLVGSIINVHVYTQENTFTNGKLGENVDTHLWLIPPSGLRIGVALKDISRIEGVS
jgi:hypothetical protein